MATLDKNAPYPVTKTVRVTGMSCGGCEKKVADGLAGVDGVMEVKPSAKKNRVKVTYDLRTTKLTTIESALTGLGCPLDDGFLAKRMRGWNHFSEGNAADAMNIDPHCCNKVPTGAGSAAHR